MVGLLAIWGPFGFLALVTLNAIPGGEHVTVANILVVWAFVWILGFGASTLGLATMRGSRLGGSARAGVKGSFRSMAAAGVTLLLGFLVLASTVAFVGSCEHGCTGGGGVVGNHSATTEGCGAPCAINLGNSTMVWPIQLLAISIVLGVIGAVLATVAVGREFLPSPARPVTPPE
jgi:hypothetical protein